MATARKDQFFKESLELIHHQGYKGTTMRDIANKLDCDVANLYNFVKSKEEILVKSLFGINDEFHEGIDLILESAYDPIAKLRQITQLYVRLTYEKPYEISLLVNGWRNLNGQKKEEFIIQKTAYEAKVRGVIEEGINVGALKPLDPTLATNMVLSSMRWLFDSYVNSTETFNPVEVERQINAFVISGISA